MCVFYRSSLLYLTIQGALLLLITLVTISLFSLKKYSTNIIVYINNINTYRTNGTRKLTADPKIEWE